MIIRLVQFPNAMEAARVLDEPDPSKKIVDRLDVLDEVIRQAELRGIDIEFLTPNDHVRERSVVKSMRADGYAII